MDESPIRPLNDFILIEPEPIPDNKAQMGYTHGEVPETLKYGPTEPPLWGRIVCKGPQCVHPNLGPGLRVLYPRYGWTKVSYKDQPFILVKEGDLRCCSSTVTT